jgi:hypothetical protein
MARSHLGHLFFLLDFHLMMDSGVRTCRSILQTAATVAIRSRLRFSPCDKRVLSL